MWFCSFVSDPSAFLGIAVGHWEMNAFLNAQLLLFSDRASREDAEARNHRNGMYGAQSL